MCKTTDAITETLRHKGTERSHSVLKGLPLSPQEAKGASRTNSSNRDITPHDTSCPPALGPPLLSVSLCLCAAFLRPCRRLAPMARPPRRRFLHRNQPPHPLVRQPKHQMVRPPPRQGPR